MHVKRARILDADEETLGYVPPWYGTRILELGRLRCARIGLSGPATPGLLDDLDPRRAGLDQLPFVREAGVVVNERTTNWTIVPYPTLGWARQVHPGLADDEALARLSEQILHVCRLDEDDPVAAWKERADLLVATAERVTERRFDALRFEGPGHRPHGRAAADDALHGGALRDRRRHRPHAQPALRGDLRRARPAAHRRRRAGDQAARHRRLDHQGPRGRVPRRQARCASTPTRAPTCCAATPRATRAPSRLGEVALVDGDGRIGKLETVFFDTLLDENAASHIALGESYRFTAGEEDYPRLNHSSIHVDFMIGGDEVAVTGITAAGEDVPVLRDGAWQL